MKRPHVIINCAMSADGKIASPTRKQMRISCNEDIERMYRLRNESDAVLVGVGTILTDDPKLTVKETHIQQPKQPLRVILDSTGRTPANALALNTVSKTVIITGKGKKKTYDGPHIQVIECSTNKAGLIDVHCALELLYQLGVRKLLVEGGGTIIWNFLKQKVVDDLYIFIGPCVIGGKETPTVADGEGITVGEEIPLKIVEVKKVGSGVLIHYQPI
ncbi:MAG TPA: 2,5-diamino-6-(ribosylamino)-4(3H)-pyrimidinone 5'-phosphate reductase [Candidatus Thermoplasmatota archaeon]|nr:2,5-diamino-6-(ribosylamino)-4(3H)-pyrimidinone 5'-phosphate reductase [Candidatus Thermoplasmatota archaeon]